jgi:hypothetical protein
MRDPQKTALCRMSPLIDGDLSCFRIPKGWTILAIHQLHGRRDRDGCHKWVQDAPQQAAAEISFLYRARSQLRVLLFPSFNLLYVAHNLFPRVSVCVLQCVSLAPFNRVTFHYICTMESCKLVLKRGVLPLVSLQNAQLLQADSHLCKVVLEDKTVYNVR